MKLKLRPLTLKEANELIGRLHRHHKPVVGHRFTIGVEKDGVLVGAAVTGRPTVRMTEQYRTAEVTRLVTDGTPHVCSKLYAASARAAEAMGYEAIQTFILENEPGTSLKAAGWELGVNRATSRRYFSMLDPVPMCKCGLPVTHGGWCSVRYSQSEKRQAVMRRMQSNRKRCQRRLVSWKFLGDGWWEFYLKCGHGGKILLGPPPQQQLEHMDCRLCREKLND